MLSYRIHLIQSAGRPAELIDFKCEDDDAAYDAVADYLQPSQSAEVWQGTRLVSRVRGRVALWRAGVSGAL
jgi:hypothetical protein